jgi:hypothetical protein
MRLIDLTNKKFGDWTVLRKDLKQRWIAKCICGRIYSVRGKALRNKRSSRCMDCKIQRSKINGERIPSKLFSTIKWGAKTRNLVFDSRLTKKYLFDLYLKQNKKCKLSGLDICFAKDTKSHAIGATTASLDRIDSQLGYTPENIQWVHKDINAIKQNFPENYLFYLCKLIVSNNEKGINDLVQNQIYPKGNEFIAI